MGRRERGEDGPQWSADDHDRNGNRTCAGWILGCRRRKFPTDGDELSNDITLETEGPNFTKPGEMSKYKDIIEFKTPDHRALTSMMQVENGEWTTFSTGNVRRKK
jgi:hypothetical protein